MKFISNAQLDLAFDYVRYTNKNLFLTGKAGTGKTTFLQKVKKMNLKRMVVVAPTGVAAINAGGMTIHSFFQLPFGPQVPGVSSEPQNQRKFAKAKINLMKSLDLLVIDEISMVRADLLDAVDSVLRRFRDHWRPFGGVQLLMVGDLHQLPPVVNDDEWQLLRPYYDTPYFFSSKALCESYPVTIELVEIFRQSDKEFIDLLNKVRNNEMNREVLQTLNTRYRSNFQPADSDNYITLTSHNHTAHEINARHLEAIREPSFIFKAKVQGDFPEHAYPNEETLELKEGAQVMFVKNDLSPEKLYFNGKIGRIARIEQDAVYVKCEDMEEEISVSPVDWSNVKYTLDEQTKTVNEDVIGVFTQYPLKLAWAITIHKSQGLTFDRAIIDAQAAFAHGQVYVALSRCRSFEGIVLRTMIDVSSVKTDIQVRDFTQKSRENAPDETQLALSKREYQQLLLRELFGFKTAQKYFDLLKRNFLEHQNTLPPKAYEQFRALAEKMKNEIIDVAGKFNQHLEVFFRQPEMPEENLKLQERLKKAGEWFYKKLNDEVLSEMKKVEVFSDNKTVLKTVTENIDQLQKEIYLKIACFGSLKSSFSALEIVRVKSNADIDYEAAKVFRPAKSFDRVPKDTPNPELYRQLKQWRSFIAEDAGLELYEVLSTRTLNELVQYLPTDIKSLKGIKGIGSVKSERYGAELTGIIEKYCTEHNIPSNLLSIKEQKKAQTPDTKLLSLTLFKQGKSIDEIAKERGFVPGTIEGHLCHFIRKGELDISKAMDLEAIKELSDFFHANQSTLSSDAKAHFGEKYSWGQIKMVVAHSQRKEGEEI